MRGGLSGLSLRYPLPPPPHVVQLDARGVRTAGKRSRMTVICGRECQRQRGVHGRYADTRSHEYHVLCLDAERTDAKHDERHMQNSRRPRKKR